MIWIRKFPKYINWIWISFTLFIHLKCCFIKFYWKKNIFILICTLKLACFCLASNEYEKHYNNHYLDILLHTGEIMLKHVLILSRADLPCIIILIGLTNNKSIFNNDQLCLFNQRIVEINIFLMNCYHSMTQRRKIFFNFDYFLKESGWNIVSLNALQIRYWPY